MVENIDPTNNNQICDYIFTIRVAIVRIYRIYIYVVSGITGLVWLYSTLPSSAFLHSVMQTIRANEQKYRDELEHIPYTMRSKCINVYSQVKDEFWKSNILLSRTFFTVVSIFQYMICIMGFLSSFLMAAGVYSVSASWETIEHYLLEPNRMGEIPITNGSSRRSLTYTWKSGAMQMLSSVVERNLTEFYSIISRTNDNWCYHGLFSVCWDFIGLKSINFLMFCMEWQQTGDSGSPWLSVYFQWSSDLFWNHIWHIKMVFFRIL